MATSGSTNFEQSRNQVILDAFQLLGVYGIGRTVSAEDLSFAVSMLNKMIKAWGAKGLHLWAKEEGVVYVQPDQASYLLGSTAKATLLSDEVVTQLNGAQAASATSLTVDSTSGMTVADIIGVVTTDKTIHWTTIATIPTSTTLTLTTGLDSAASDDALVYTYTTALNKPLRILSARRRTGLTTSQVDLPVVETAYESYFDLPNKNSASSPNQFHYSPKVASGNLYLYPAPSDGSERICITFERIIEDLDSTSDTFDFPPEWLEALTYQLAVRLGPPFGKDQRTMGSILPLASSMLEDLLNWDAEISEVEMVPDLRDY